MLYLVLNTCNWLQAWTTGRGCSTLEKSCLFPGLNSISLPSPVLRSVSNSLHIPSQPTQIRSLVQGVGLFPRHSRFGFPSPALSSTAMFTMLTPCMSSKLLLLPQASDQTHINTLVKRFPVSSPAVAHILPPSVVAPLILYSKSLSMGLLQHTGFLEHIFFLSLNFYDFHLCSTSSTQSQNYTLWILTMFRIFHLRGHKCQFPSLSLVFSIARPALSTVSDLTRPFYFPSRCQSPLGFSSVVDHLKSQSWILQICPANQHCSKAPICGLCSCCRSGGLSWEKDYTVTWSWVQTPGFQPLPGL